MIALAALLAVLGQTDVDMTLTPTTQNVTVGCIAEVELVLSTAVSADISAFDVVLSWDPAQVSLVQAVPSTDPWFATGFLNDPDDVNDDLADGDAIYTAFADPLNPLSLPPTKTVVTFEFLVLDEAMISILPTIGVFGSTKVVGVTPGQIVTGTLSGPTEITTAVGTWTDIGGGAPGIAGVPTLVGSGTLAGGCPAAVTLTNAPPNALMLAWISLTSTPFPAIGGTVHAFPFINQLFFVANGAGTFVGATTWPKGVPPGTNIWFQFVVQDLSVPDGLTLSNAVLATTPIP